MSFKEFTIDNCCYILNNLRFPINSEQRFEMKGEYPYYGANGVQDYINKWKFDDDLILIAEDGGNFEQYSFKPIAYRVKGKCWVNNHAHVLKAKEDFSQGFIFYSLEHKNILFFIAGGTRSKLTQNELKKITLNIPLKNEAERIREILEATDEAIGHTESLIAKYQRIKTGLMQDLLTKGIDENGNIRSKETHKFVVRNGIEVPEEWEVFNLKDLGNIVTGFTPVVKQIDNYGDDYCFITPSDVTENQFIQTTARKLSHKGFELCRHLPENSVCVVCIGSTIGKIAMVKELSTSNQQINSLIPTDFHLSVYYYYSMMLYLGSQLRREAGLQAVPIVNKSSFSKMIIPVPKNKEESLRIINLINEVQQVFETYNKYLKKLHSLKAGLMQDLLSGKVRVKI